MLSSSETTVKSSSHSGQATLRDFGGGPPLVLEGLHDEEDSAVGWRGLLCCTGSTVPRLLLSTLLVIVLLSVEGAARRLDLEPGAVVRLQLP